MDEYLFCLGFVVSNHVVANVLAYASLGSCMRILENISRMEITREKNMYILNVTRLLSRLLSTVAKLIFTLVRDM